MQFIALGNLHGHGLPPIVFDGFGKGLACVASIRQDALHTGHLCRNSAFAIRHVRRGHGDGMRQSDGINGNMPLDARHLFDFDPSRNDGTPALG